MKTLANDPGVNNGSALFEDGVLRAVALTRSQGGAFGWEQVAQDVYHWALRAGDARAGSQAFGCAADTLVLEWPQVYQGGRQKGDPNDLLPLAALNGALRALFPAPRLHLPKPSDWKGQVPKDIMGARILSKLTAEEKAVWNAAQFPKSLAHNVLDAVGLGLYSLRRLG